MDCKVLITRLAAGRRAIPALLDGVGAEQAAWRPEPGKWSLLEVVCHLADEEREDFRQRLRLTLTDPSTPWPGIDPPGWVTERRYAERDFNAALADFVNEREQSLEWLVELAEPAKGPEPAWNQAYEHPLLGTIRAGDILASWAAHDLLHTRQIAGLHFAWTTALAAPYTPDYAGEW